MVQFGIFDHIEGIAGTDMGQLLPRPPRPHPDGRRGRLLRLPPRRAPRHRPVHGAEPGDLPRRGRRSRRRADPPRSARQDPSPPSPAPRDRGHLHARPAHRRARRVRRRPRHRRDRALLVPGRLVRRRASASTRRSRSSCAASARASTGRRPAASTTTSPRSRSRCGRCRRRTLPCGTRATPSSPAATASGWCGPVRSREDAYDLYVSSVGQYKDDPVRADGPASRPRVGVTMLHRHRRRRGGRQGDRGSWLARPDAARRRGAHLRPARPRRARGRGGAQPAWLAARRR